MTSTNRLIVNTLAQHIRTLVNICLSLYSTRLVLEFLGQADYGIYMLVAGIVSFLSYFTTAIVTTTQRHLSYSYGQHQKEKTKLIFANSYITNILLGIVLIILMIGAMFVLFNGRILNIDSDKYDEAQWVYLIVLVSVFTTFITAPFKALFIARENIVYISAIDILDGVLKVLLVFGLELFDTHRLVIYACILTFVMIFNFLALAGYARYKYEECCLIPDIRKWDSEIQKNLLGFTTWTIYGSVSIYLRNQSLAIFLNRAYGTIINASFGIASQVLGSIAFLSGSILNAFTPQIIQAEGEGNRNKMLELSMKACKYCYLLLAVVAIPISFEIDAILRLWLGVVPEYAPLFCQIFLISTLVDQLTTGLNTANQALGKIRNYTLLIYTTKLLTIPVIWVAMHLGVQLLTVMMIYMSFEFITAVIRIPYVSKTTGMDMKKFWRDVIRPIVVPTLVASIVCLGMTQIEDSAFRFVATGIVSTIVTLISIWYFSLVEKEQDYIRNVILAKIHQTR